MTGPGVVEVRVLNGRLWVAGIPVAGARSALAVVSWWTVPRARLLAALDVQERARRPADPRPWRRVGRRRIAVGGDGPELVELLVGCGHERRGPLARRRRCPSCTKGGGQ